jgi:hypothetical protein
MGSCGFAGGITAPLIELSSIAVRRRARRTVTP